MCPCDAACKTVRLVEIFIDLSQRKSVILGEETAKQNLPCAELSGFVRLAFLRKNKKARRCVPWSHRRPSHVSYVSHMSHPLRRYIARTHRSAAPIACTTLRHSGLVKSGAWRIKIHHSSFIITLSLLGSPCEAAQPLPHVFEATQSTV